VGAGTALHGTLSDGAGVKDGRARMCAGAGAALTARAASSCSCAARCCAASCCWYTAPRLSTRRSKGLGSVSPVLGGLGSAAAASLALSRSCSCTVWCGNWRCAGAAAACGPPESFGDLGTVSCLGSGWGGGGGAWWVASGTGRALNG